MRKKLLNMIIVSLIMSICIILSFSLTSSASDILSSSMSSMSNAESGMSDQLKTMHNMKFEVYEGRKSGAIAKEISDVINTNNVNPDNYQVTLDSCEIDSNSSIYNVTLSYDNDGVVNKVSITKAEDSSNNATNNTSDTNSNVITDSSLNTNTGITTNDSLDSDSQISYDDDKISFDTESDTDLPQTGKSNTTGLLLIVLSIISIIALIKYKKIK